MMFWLCSCGVILCLAVLLGRYRLEGEIEAGSGRFFRRFRLVSAGRLFGFEWDGRSAQGSLFLLLFALRIRIRASQTRRKPRASGVSAFEKIRRRRPQQVREVLKWLIRMVRAVRLDKLSISGTFGLADPALTGWAFGIMQSIRCLLPERFVLDVEPDFTTRTIQGKAAFAAGFWLPSVLAASFRTAWKGIGIRRKRS
jgi:hypothetical protein